MTDNREDYIKAIYELGGERNRISTKAIADVLKISQPSVSEMLKKLAAEEVLDYVVYKGVKLTEKGSAEAIRIKRIHILWEVFLVEKLGYDLADVHEEAELLEHITSKKLEEKLEAFLNYPKVCPHGTPLNSDEYLFAYTRLNEYLVGDTVILKRLQDDKKFLNEVASLNLNIEDRLEIIRYKNKEFTVKVNGRLIELSKAQADNIYVNKEILWKKWWSI